MLKNYLKYYWPLIVKALLRIICFFLPVSKDKFLFEVFRGNQLTCNPYYIYEFLLKHDYKFRYIWCFNKKNHLNITCVRRNSLRYFYHIVTAKVYITNCGIPSYIFFRKSQIVIDTWHGGGAYKKVGLSIASNANWYEKKILKASNRYIPYYISSSKVFTDIFSRSMFAPKEKFLPFGMPRNDLFFDKILLKQTGDKVRSMFGISSNTFIVLYAPTYRNTLQNASFDCNLDFDLLKSSIQKRFNVDSICIMVRMHHKVKNFDGEHYKGILNVSTYAQMQELLCTADMLISDYSSCIWDYSFTYRPCFLFVPDLQKYESDRDFYIPIEQWGFPMAQTNNELCSIIQNYDEFLFKLSMHHHHEALGSYEDGRASEQVTNFILSRL